MHLQSNIENAEGIERLSVSLADIGIVEWATENRQAIEEWLNTRGALLVRGLAISSSKQFGKVLNILFDAPLLSYVNRSTPRTELKGAVYTATEYRADQMIVQHNEQAYTNSWPTRIGFCCITPAPFGGETPIADSRTVYRDIPQAIRNEFIERELLYVRNYSDIDLSWQEVFCTTDKHEVERYCRENGIIYEWKSNDALRTMQKLPAVVKHPVTGEMLWFNQAHLFHSVSIGENMRNALIEMKGEDNLPRNVLFGDGSRIEDEKIKAIQETYERSKHVFQWQSGDLLLLDNMLFSHGRMPYSGERCVLVGMARPYSDKSIAGGTSEKSG